jgi:DNA-binding transcriptional LysR family regulator
VDLDTALLRAFVAVADHGGVGHAAQAMHLSQQGVSKRISRLEATLGVALLDRGPRGVTLTTAGTRLLPAARQAIDAVDAAIATTGVSGVITVDVMDEHSAAMEWVRAASERAGLPTIVTTVRPSGESMVDGLLNGSSDLSFGRASITPWPADLSRRVVNFEALGLLVGEQHPWRDRSSVPLADLARVPLRFPLAGAPRDWVDYLSQLAEECEIVVDTDGCSLGFESFVESAGRSTDTASFYGLGMRPPREPGVRVVPIVDPTPVFPWAVAWRRRWPESVVDALVGTEVPKPGGPLWLPAPDREWLGIRGRAARPSAD